MADPVKVQTVTVPDEAANNTTDVTQAVTLTAGTFVVVFQAIGNFSGASATCTCTGAGNTPVSQSYLNGAQRAAKCWTMVVTTGGAQTFTFGKAGNNGKIAGVITEWSGSANAIDGAVVFATGTGTNATQTMSATSVRNNALMAYYHSLNSITMNSAQASWTNDANNATNSQQATAYYLPNATGSFTAGWPAITNASSRAWVIIGIAVKGIAVDPTITGGTANPVHLSTGNTITGLNFGASQGAGTLVIGGVTQTVTAWADTSITYTANRGTNLDDVAVNAVVTDNSAVSSNSYALTGFDPPAGYSYVTLTSVNSTAAYRITAVGDLAIGNQIECDNALVTVAVDGTFVADHTVTLFNVRVGVTTDGWGALAAQSVNQAATASGSALLQMYKTARNRRGLF